MDSISQGKLTVRRVVIVEGRYDKIKLSSLLNASILTTNGFGIFRDREKQALIRRLAETRGLLTATDSDSAGLMIRNFIGSIVPKDTVCHLLIPPIPGREKRKTAPSKEGTLGVEGLEADLLRKLFAPFADPGADAQGAGNPVRPADPINRADLYADGLMGGEGSSSRRAALLIRLNLPRNLSTTGLIDALNMLGGRPIYEDALRRIAADAEADGADR